jgi:hypothetical protein
MTRRWAALRVSVRRGRRWLWWEEETCGRDGSIVPINKSTILNINRRGVNWRSLRAHSAIGIQSPGRPETRVGIQ